MIELNHVTKCYFLPHGRTKVVLNDISYVFPDGMNMGILGHHGSGKSTLLNVICGKTEPDSGYVRRTSRVSWPVGFKGGLNSNLTGRENLRFTCRIYGADVNQVSHFVESFTELGSYMDLPLRTYSAGMKSRLAFALSMAIEFDYYLIAGGIPLGEGSFRDRAKLVFAERLKHAALIIFSHKTRLIRKYCDNAVILENGRFLQFNTLAAAVQRYREKYNEEA